MNKYEITTREVIEKTYIVEGESAETLLPSDWRQNILCEYEDDVISWDFVSIAEVKGSDTNE